METIENYKSLGIEAKVSNPRFVEQSVRNNITYRHLIGREEPTDEHPEGKPIYEYEIKNEERHIVLCQVTATVDLFGDRDKVYCSDIGISIRNPEDDDGELGKEIAYGRAIKNPMISVSLTSNRRLPKPIINEQIVWAKKHVERNLDNYVNNLRETLKNQ